MLTCKPQLNITNAKEYFREHLKVGDYYAEDQRVDGRWFGIGAGKLGLAGVVKEKDFLDLCDGRRPGTDEFLTQRKNTTRQEDGETKINRRVFYDFVFSPPKSVSVLGLCADQRVKALHDAAVVHAMTELEKHAAFRLRKGGMYGDATSGNVVAALFQHDTSREQDPHIHTHCVCFNATHDEANDAWMALENQKMLRAQKMVLAAYNKYLADGLAGLGYGITPNARDFEITGMKETLIEKFSKRRKEIEQTAKELAALPENAGIPLAALRNRVAHEQRRRKIKDADPETLKRRWFAEMSPVERGALAACKKGSVEREVMTPGQIVAWAKSYVFERSCLVNMLDIETVALRRALASKVSLDDIRREVASELNRGTLLKKEGANEVVSREMLLREHEILAVVRAGREAHPPLVRKFDLSKTALDDEQKNAAATILKSNDLVSVFRGRAGTGKSWTLGAICTAAKAGEREIFVVAPQGMQARDLTRDGMPAQTLAKLLTRPALPGNCLVVCDEAGQVAVKDMLDLIRKVRQAGGRLVLSGDTKQHGAVAAGDALRLIESAGGRIAQISNIRRQNPDLAQSVDEKERIKLYREAAKAASAGKVEESVIYLQQVDGFVEVADELQKVEKVTETYLEAHDKKLSALVVSQTRAEVGLLNEKISSALIAREEIAGVRKITAWHSKDLLEVEKTWAANYQAGDTIRWISRYGRHQRGSMAEIASVNNDCLILKNPDGGKGIRVGLKFAKKFDVMQKRELDIGVGTQMIMRANGVSKDGVAFANGELVRVKKLGEDGSIMVVGLLDKKEKTLEPDQQVMNLGYAVTSYASQGKTCDVVILSDSTNRAAINSKEWYVSITRGRRYARIITPGLEDLIQNIAKPNDRTLASSVKLERPHASAAMRFGFIRRFCLTIKEQQQRIKLWMHQ
jgi:conjugative relaxase-like TrwC/TraI family protein